MEENHIGPCSRKELRGCGRDGATIALALGWRSRIRAMPRSADPVRLAVVPLLSGWPCSLACCAVLRIREIARVAQSATLWPVPARNLPDLLEALTGSG